METLLGFTVRSSFSGAVAEEEMSGCVRGAGKTWGPAGRDETVLGATVPLLCEAKAHSGP